MARWPSSASGGPHAPSHATGGTDELTPAVIAAIPASQKGAANGVASLGADSKVPAAQLPASSGGGGGSPLLPEGLLYTRPPQEVSGAAGGPGATVLDFIKVNVPKAGTLRDLTVWVMGGENGDFLRTAVYSDAGAFLWASARRAPGARGAFTSGDPVVAVSAGPLWLAISVGTVLSLSGYQTQNNVGGDLPTGFWGANTRTLGSAAIPDMDTFPANVDLTALSATARMYAMVARIA